MSIDDTEIDSISAKLSSTEPTEEQEILCHLLDDVTIYGVDHGLAQFLVSTILIDGNAISESHESQLKQLVWKYRGDIRRNVVDLGIIDPEIQEEVDDPNEFLVGVFATCKEERKW